MYHNHHIIPISLWGEHIKKNKLKIIDVEHRTLHYTQNFDYWIIRRYKEKTNWLLVPNDVSLALKKELRKKFFEKVIIRDEEQLDGLNDLSGEENKDFMIAVDVLIEKEREKIKNIIIRKAKFLLNNLKT